MRQIFLLNITPCRPAFSRCQFRLIVDDVLELINGDSVRQERHAACKVTELVLGRLIAEEFFHPRISKVFHRHRVDFTGFIRREPVFRHGEVTAFVDLERVSDFVCQDIDVTGRSVEVREDEWEFFVRDVRAIAAACFTRFRRQVERAAFKHVFKELICLR